MEVFSLDEVRTAFDRNEFFLEYLPTMLLDGVHCVGAEALVRWRRDSTVILPGDFVPVLEETSHSGLLTYWVIETAARELGDWLRHNDGVHLSINVPPEILGRGGMEYAASRSGIMDLAAKFILEVTERGVPDRVGLEALDRAREMGVRVALDDVGTGGASLAVVCRLPVCMIKVDHSFAEKLFFDRGSHEWLDAFTSLTRGADLDVVVEGVETPEQAETLHRAGVKMAQGWYFSRPLSAQAFQAFHCVHRQDLTWND